MKEYISKSALVAEIERRLKALNDCHADRVAGYAGEISGLKRLLSFLNTLEVKEVDLQKEYKEYVEEDPVYNKLVNGIVGKAIAKHFFELGLNSQHSSINIPNIDDILEEEGIDPFSKEAKTLKESYYMALDKLKAQKGE